MASLNDIENGDFTIQKCVLEQRYNGGWTVDLPQTHMGEMATPVASFSDTESLIKYLTEKLNK